MRTPFIALTLTLLAGAFAAPSAQADPLDEGAVQHEQALAATTPVVAVIDSAVADGPELSGRLVAGPACAAAGGVDERFHGEAIATLIAASDNGVGVRGMLPGARIVSYAATVGDQAHTGCIVEAIDHASANGIRVINLSFSAPSVPPEIEAALRAAIVRARARGSLVVVAAGNWQGEVGIPGRSPEALTVSAPGYATGSSVDVVAPGVGYATTRSSGAELPRINAGTSLAAAMTSAVAADLFARRPQSTPDEVEAALRGTLSVATAEARLGLPASATTLPSAAAPRPTPSARPLARPRVRLRTTRNRLTVTVTSKATAFEIRLRGRSLFVTARSTRVGLARSLRGRRLVVRVRAIDGRTKSHWTTARVRVR